MPARRENSYWLAMLNALKIKRCLVHQHLAYTSYSLVSFSLTQKVFHVDAEEKQLARVAELCKAPGAEHEASHSVIANTPAAAIRAASNTALHSSLHASASTSNHNPAATTSESTIPAVAMIPEPIHVQSAPPALEESHAHKARKDGSSMVHKDDTENSAGSFEASSLAALVPVVLALIVNSSI